MLSGGETALESQVVAERFPPRPRLLDAERGQAVVCEHGVGRPGSSGPVFGSRSRFKLWLHAQQREDLAGELVPGAAPGISDVEGAAAALLDDVEERLGQVERIGGTGDLVVDDAERLA